MCLSPIRKRKLRIVGQGAVDFDRQAGGLKQKAYEPGDDEESAKNKNRYFEHRFKTLCSGASGKHGNKKT